MLSVIKHIVIMLNGIITSAVILSFIVLSAILLNDINTFYWVSLS